MPQQETKKQTVTLIGILECYVHYHGANAAYEITKDEVLKDDEGNHPDIHDVIELLNEWIPEWKE